jgi:acyl dehydratase
MTGGQPERRLYFEDVQTGVPLETPAMTLTETHAALFASLGAARPGEPGAIPDLLPLCLSSGLGWRVPQPPLVVLAFMGFEWRFLKPTRVGDTIRSVSKTVAKRSMKEGGVVIEERSILNQHGQVVQSGRLTLLVAKRPAS